MPRYFDHPGHPTNPPDNLTLLSILIVVAIIVVVVAGAALAGIGGHAPPPTGLPVVRDVPCAEDVMVIVAPDPDPDHGLTWVCGPALDDVMDPDDIAALDLYLAEHAR